MIAHARAKLLAIVALFALPIVGSTVAYYFFTPRGTSNYGELLLPPDTITAARFQAAGGGEFDFASLRGRWVLVVSDAGACPESCRAKLTLVRQVRLMLGREAGRVTRVFVADDARPPEAGLLTPFEGTHFVAPPPGPAMPRGPVNDRAHVYLVDPQGNVMMRFPAEADPQRMRKDLERLLKASQIG